MTKYRLRLLASVSLAVSAVICAVVISLYNIIFLSLGRPMSLLHVGKDTLYTHQSGTYKILSLSNPSEIILFDSLSQKVLVHNVQHFEIQDDCLFVTGKQQKAKIDGNNMVTIENIK